MFLQMTSWLLDHETKGEGKHVEKESKDTAVRETAVEYIGLDLEQRSRKGMHLESIGIDLIFKIIRVEKVKNLANVDEIKEHPGRAVEKSNNQRVSRKG